MFGLICESFTHFLEIPKIVIRTWVLNKESVIESLVNIFSKSTNLSQKKGMQ